MDSDVTEVVADSVDLVYVAGEVGVVCGITETESVRLVWGQGWKEACIQINLNPSTWYEYRRTKPGSNA